MKKYNSWADYFDAQPARGREMLEEMKQIFEETVPEAEESWGYGVPAYDLVPNAKLDKKIMIAGFKNHIGFYPSPDTIETFIDELEGFKVLKGTIQIKHKQEIPTDLIRRMILHRYHMIKNKQNT